MRAAGILAAFLALSTETIARPIASVDASIATTTSSLLIRDANPGGWTGLIPWAVKAAKKNFGKVFPLVSTTKPIKTTKGAKVNISKRDANPGGWTGLIPWAVKQGKKVFQKKPKVVAKPPAKFPPPPVVKPVVPPEKLVKPKPPTNPRLGNKAPPPLPIERRPGQTANDPTPKPKKNPPTLENPGGSKDMGRMTPEELSPRALHALVEK